MLLMIDNYDSFTFNIVQYLKELGEEIVVRRNDAVSIGEIEKMRISGIVISPGPCTPREAGITKQCIEYFAGKKPILGICLGHQAIADVFGAKVVRAKYPVHGKTSEIEHDGKRLFQGIQNRFLATRYHSLIVEPGSLNGNLEISAMTDDNVIMGLRHKEYLIEGVQFHPESILTQFGRKMLTNFMDLLHV